MQREMLKYVVTDKQSANINNNVSILRGEFYAYHLFKSVNTAS